MNIDETTIKTLKISEIAQRVRRDWKRVYFGAEPYLGIMFLLDTLDDDYGAVSGREIVARFLCNATNWRGPVARLIKAELNRRLKIN